MTLVDFFAWVFMGFAFVGIAALTMFLAGELKLRSIPFYSVEAAVDEAWEDTWER